ncbi:MAG: hypothetical protein ACRD9R_11020 [Pyrinomonadaceae bacterium]
MEDATASLPALATHCITGETRTQQTLMRNNRYRSGAIPLHVPALREWREDIPALAKFSLRSLASDLGRERIELTADAISELQESAWPGNIRELCNVLERAVLLNRNSTIEKNFRSAIRLRSAPIKILISRSPVSNL